MNLFLRAYFYYNCVAFIVSESKACKGCPSSYRTKLVISTTLFWGSGNGFKSFEAIQVKVRSFTPLTLNSAYLLHDFEFTISTPVALASLPSGTLKHRGLLKYDFMPEAVRYAARSLATP